MKQTLLVLHTIVLTLSQVIGFVLVCLLGMVGIDAFAETYPRLFGYAFLALLVVIGLFCWGKDNYEMLASKQRVKDKRDYIDAKVRDTLNSLSRKDDDNFPPTGAVESWPKDGHFA